LIAHYDGYGNGSSTYLLASTTNAGATATTCVKIPALGIGIYYISIYSETPAFDSLATAYYVGTTNQVTVTADVDPTMSFTLSSNSCDLGVLSTAGISNCSYNGTTTSNTAGSTGAVVVNVKGNSSNLSYGTANIGPTGGNCNPVAASTNGIRVSATSTGDWQSTAAFDCGTGSATPVPTAAAGTAMITSGASWDGLGTFTIQHQAMAAANSNVGHYTQQITYTVTMQF
jgi:hypothetical protein